MADDALDEIERVFGLLSEQFGVQVGSVPVDLIDEGDAFVVRADLPGYDAEDVDVTLRDPRTVRITASRERERAEGRYVRHERRQHTADRTVSLPDAVDADDASATYDAGVLTARFAKRADESDEGTDVPVR